ncbi:MAG: palindromic element RPE1 domain-containing protein [Candidatus Tisiphia sp.]
MTKQSNRPLSKLAYAEEFEGDAERRTAAYSNVREDSSTASTYKSPAEVEFRKRSNECGLPLHSHGLLITSCTFMQFLNAIRR